MDAELRELRQKHSTELESHDSATSELSQTQQAIISANEGRMAAVANTEDANQALMEAQKAQWDAEAKRKQVSEELEAAVAEGAELHNDVEALLNALQAERDAHAVSPMYCLFRALIISFVL